MESGQCDEYYSRCTENYDGPSRNVSFVEHRRNLFIASINHNPPYSYESPPGSLCFCGLSIALLDIVATDIQKQLILIPDRHTTDYGTSYFGSPYDVQTGLVDISVCPLSVNPERLMDFNMIQSYAKRSYQIGVHKSHMRHGPFPVLPGLITSIDRNGWYGISLLSVVLVILLWCTKVLGLRKGDTSCKRLKVFRETFWEVFSVSLNQGGQALHRRRSLSVVTGW
ncbi:uncharacterized protein LOC129600118 [Paramacrobiotus metropolitanus]|uniref:uncharacterized protein LOC129600118 n=1 Tax=Paramacrobiotus metropolitanus TaxID=2943436 RepID=UPI0024462B7F|nr:uncharacterized protein LOC129600118 [Paramacrobiotus metropolitanus]